MNLENILQENKFTIYIEQTTYANKIDEFKAVIQEFLEYKNETEYKFNFELPNGNDAWVRLRSNGYEHDKTVAVDLFEDLSPKEHLLKNETVEEVISIINKELSSFKN